MFFKFVIFLIRKFGKNLVEIVGETGIKRPVSCCAGAVFSDANKDVIVVSYAVPNGPLIAEQITIDRVSLVEIEKRSYEKITFQPAFIVSVAVHIIYGGISYFHIIDDMSRD